MNWKTLWFPARLLLLLLFGFVAWQAWTFSRPLPRTFTPRELEVLENAVARALQPLEERLAGTPTRFAIARFFHDAGDEVTASTRLQIADHPEWTVLDSSPIQQFLSDITATILQATSLDEIVHAGRRVGIDVLIAGDVLRADTTEDNVSAAIRFNAYDTRTSEWLVAGVYESTWTPSTVTRAGLRIRNLPGLIKWLIWLALIISLPWLAAPLIHRTVEQKNNLRSFLTLGSLTLLNLIPALLFWEFDLNRPGGVIRLLALLIICSIWNWWAAEKIADNQ